MWIVLRVALEVLLIIAVVAAYNAYQSRWKRERTRKRIRATFLTQAMAEEVKTKLRSQIPALAKVAKKDIAIEILTREVESRDIMATVVSMTTPTERAKLKVRFHHRSCYFTLLTIGCPECGVLHLGECNSPTPEFIRSKSDVLPLDGRE